MQLTDVFVHERVTELVVWCFDAITILISTCHGYKIHMAIVTICICRAT